MGASVFRVRVEIGFTKGRTTAKVFAKSAFINQEGKLKYEIKQD